MYNPHSMTLAPATIAHWVHARVGPVSAVLILFPLAACATSEPTRVSVPTPVPCVDPADIPPEPEQVGDQFNGDAKHDLQILAPSALELRKWGRELRALIVPGCTTVAN